jgi:diguanylate cyclase with GGDEF domain
LFVRLKRKGRDREAISGRGSFLAWLSSFPSFLWVHPKFTCHLYVLMRQEEPAPARAHGKGEDAIQTSASIGVAYFAGGQQNAEGLINEADEALYEAKRRGRNRYWVHTPEAAVAI